MSHKPISGLKGVKSGFLAMVRMSAELSMRHVLLWKDSKFPYVFTIQKIKFTVLFIHLVLLEIHD